MTTSPKSTPKTEGNLQKTDPICAFSSSSPELLAASSPKKGSLVDLYYNASSIEGAPQKHAFVYLPAGYTPAKRYPALYLLHGIGGDEGEWVDRKENGRGACIDILDRLIASGEIEEVVVIFPNGRTCPQFADRSYDIRNGVVAMTDSVRGFYRFDRELRRDLIPAAEREFSLRACRTQRALAGLSMGAMQALNLGTRCLDLFSSIGSFSCGPTTECGTMLGLRIAESGFPLRLLYAVCGEDDDLSYPYYLTLLEGLKESAGEALGAFITESLPGRRHDFSVWNYGAEAFLKLVYGVSSDGGK